MVGLVGRKEGTRQIFQEGRAIQVTYLSLLPNRVTQIKTQAKDGYQAIQLTTDQRAEFRLSRPEAGHFKKAGVAAGRGLWEFRLDQEGVPVTASFELGQELTVEQFKTIEWVDVTAITKGKGFAGTIKRHHFASQDATHGNSLSHRAQGSIGQRKSPSRVFKRKKMPGQLGNKQRTIQSLQVLAVYPEHHLLVIKGSVPGAPRGTVIVKPAIRLQHIKKAL